MVFPSLVPELFRFARAAWLFLRAMLSPCSPASQVSAVPTGLLLRVFEQNIPPGPGSDSDKRRFGCK